MKASDRSGRSIDSSKSFKPPPAGEVNGTKISGRTKPLRAERPDMSVETTPIEDLGTQLGEAIAETPEYERFQEAKAAVEDSPEAQELIGEFNQLRQEFVLARKVGEATNEDVQKVQQAQQDLHELPVMADYLEAQDALANRLDTVNDAISEGLDVDFAGQASTCCQEE
jgi:cell fate (sporulation/competence/biofilm development) regulator YlbF (YheA/YmcA/DUF963 family)